jgi:hypothetical protein
VDLEGQELAQVDWHRHIAVESFNRVWELIEQPNRSPADDRTLLEAAFTSRYHWGVVGEIENQMVGDWQLARVLADLKYGEPALLYAESCLTACQAHDFGPYFLGAAYEVMARALAVIGSADQAQQNLAQAREIAQSVPDPDDRAYLLNQLDAIVIG